MNDKIVRIDPYASHQPFLMLAVANTTGPILELGAGHYSTPPLHAFAPLRGMVTIDNDPDWLDSFERLQNEWHKLVIADGWFDALSSLQRHRIGLCFVDQAPPESRGPAITQLRPFVDVFVCHDTQPAEGDPNLYLGVLDTFKYRLDDDRDPRTSIVSDIIDVGKWPK